MTKQLTTTPDALATVGKRANERAAAASFAKYQGTKAKNTLRRQRADLALFADYLATVGIDTSAGELGTTPAAWAPITWGIVDGFQAWQLTAGYSVGSVNVRLSTVKVYAKLATQAGAITPGELAMIQTVKTYSRGEAKKLNEKREAAGIPTRMTRHAKAIKKAAPVTITRAQARELKAQPDTPQGRRDCVIMCLLLDHGLRVGELAGLTVESFNLVERQFVFYRPKVDKTQTHELTRDSYAAVSAWLGNDAPNAGPLLRGSRKGGKLTGEGMAEKNITERVRTLGSAAGIEGLSAHDCRHYWATQAARNSTPLDRLKDAGGWSNYTQPLRYIEDAKIANEGVNL